MPFILKTTPFAASPGDIFVVVENPMYGGGDIRRGDEAFVWFSETEGGNGLAWQCHVADVAPAANGAIAATVCLSNEVSLNCLGKSELEPYRNVRDATPHSELARILYYHALNKVAALRHEDAEFLRQFFRAGSIGFDNDRGMVRRD